MSYANAVLLGRQEPRFLVSPPRVSSAGAECVELAESAGLVLDPWQRLVVEEALGERADGRFAAMEVGLQVPRQNGKGSILEALTLAGLFLLDEMLIVHSAHLFKTAIEAFRRMLTLIEGAPDLCGELKRVNRSHGDEGIELMSGQRLVFVARGRGSGRGLSGDRVILDEAYNLSAEMMADLLPTLSARDNPQIVYTSSPGFGVAHQESDVFWSVRRRALTGATTDRLLWMEWAAHDEGCTSDSQEALAEGNPGLGIRLTEEFSATERGALTDQAYRRERLGLWDGTRKLADDEGDSLVDLWRLCSWPGSVMGDRREWGVDVSPGQRSAAVWAAGDSSAGGRHLELVEFRPGASWLPGRCAELVAKWGGRVGLDSSGPAGELVPELRAAGIEPVEVSNRDYAAACGSLLTRVRAGGQVRHRVPSEWEPVVHAALAGAAKADVGDGLWKWSRKSSAVDISPLPALTIADHLAGLPAAVTRPVFAY